MKTLSPERLDKATPKWPEVRITLHHTNPDSNDGAAGDGCDGGDSDGASRPGATVTVSGVITDVADEAEALTRTAAQARTLGRPIRARITGGDGTVRRLVVATDGTVTALDLPPTSGPAHTDQPAGPGGSAPVRTLTRPRTGKTRIRRLGRRGTGVVAHFPAPLRPVLQWGVPVVGVLFLAAVVVLVVRGGSSAEPVGPPPVAAVPPAGQLYTELAPPGWTQQAAWTVQLAADAPAPVATTDDTIVAVTAEDRSAVPDQNGDRYLSVLEPDGRTRWAVPLDTAPRLGPVVITVDRAQVVLVAGTRELTYWPIAGGPETVVPLPAGAKVTPTGLVELRDDQLGYLHNGALTVVDTLPRTQPAIAVDGAAIVSQTDTGAWWTLRDGQQPTAVTPAPPAGITGVERVLTVAADHVFIAWATADTDNCVVGVYDTGTGAPQASTTVPCRTLPRTGAAYASNGTTAGIGPLILNGTNLTVADGATITAIVDQTYGTAHGNNVTITAEGATTSLPNGTLIPTGKNYTHLLVVDSDQRLYALSL